MSEEVKPENKDTPLEEIYLPYQFGLRFLLEYWWQHEWPTNAPTEDECILLLANLYRETRKAAKDTPEAWPVDGEPEESLDKFLELMKMMQRLALRS